MNTCTATATATTSTSTITTATAVIHPEQGAEVVREVRKLVAEALDACCRAGCEEAGNRADDVLLVVSELVTNACRHAGGVDEVRVQVCRGELMVEVADGSDAVPAEPADEAKGESGGYGCQLVTALADRWGVTSRTAPGTTETCGKTVYAGFALG
ncbi:ATP-binding protein [Streptomyces bambusae]|uniref:ATP-binding protein n=1 Tax=Streptomyces bambusae TaxID=1550616 RepID=UPI001CFE63AC|nr:ATP-binding protein [Streptomyces bambusae]MCB5164577.1 ATP-binding protein [Streptomyces bambusae]